MTEPKKPSEPSADEIPEGAQLFMGFTSTQRSALAPGRLVNFESMPGFSDQWPRGYFRHGTTMHLSHLFAHKPPGRAAAAEPHLISAR